MTAPPELLILGHVCRDEIQGEHRLGGAASFAALAAVTLGVRTALVTVAPAGSSLLAPLQALSRLSLQVVPSPELTAFALDYSGPRRRLIQRAVAPPLRIEDVPAAWRGAPVAYVAPIAGECDGPLIESLDSRLCCAGLQGWLRRPASDGTVEPALAPEVVTPPRGLRVAVLSEEDHPEAERLAEGLARRGLVVGLTRGRRGATLLHGVERWEVPAAPAREVDPTGAGDVFGLGLTLALARGASVPQAGAVAATLAARVVEGPGLGRLSEADAVLLPGPQW